MLSILNIILGAALLVSGRKLFWLFVAASGFMAGVQFATRVIHGPDGLTLLIGLAVGVGFAVLAMFLKSFAISLAGFFLGGAILSGSAETLGFNDMRMEWILYIIGGVIGIILVAALFDWALIGLSSFGGAALLAQSFNLNRPLGGLAFMALLIVGTSVQANAMQQERKQHA